MNKLLALPVLSVFLTACGGFGGVVEVPGPTIEVPGPTVEVPGPTVEVPVEVPVYLPAPTVPPVTCQVWTTLGGNAALSQVANTTQYLALTDSVKGDIEIGLQNLNLLEVANDTLPFAAFVGTAASAVTNNFSLRCGFNYEAKNAGVHKFVLTSDDGSQLFVNGSLRINNGGAHGMTAVTANVTLPVGVHSLTLKFYEGSGPKGLSLTVQPPAVVQPSTTL